MSDANATTIKAWDTILFQKFVRFRHLLTDGLSGHSDAALERHAPPVGARVLDVGCGFGDTCLHIAERIGPAGAAVGVDCAANFIAEARRDADRLGVSNVRFLMADVQHADLLGPYDQVFSRFGTMFFVSPLAALRNLRRSLVPGGELVMVLWRKREDNPWLYDAECAVRELVPVVSHETTDQVHCGPGPFSLASADLASTLLVQAGFERIRFERYDTDICIGRDLEEGVAFATELGPAGEIIRLAGDDGERLKPMVMRTLRDTLARYQRPNGLWAGSSSWLVTARNPA